MPPSAVRPLTRSVSRFTDDQLDNCISLYQPDYGDEELTRDKAGEILHNVTSVYGLLATWAQRSDRRKAARVGAARRQGVARG